LQQGANDLHVVQLITP